MEEIHFKILEKNDLPTLHKWHNEPHVKQWYDKDRDLSSLKKLTELYSPVLNGSDPTQSYIIQYNDAPIGYIQTYIIQNYPDYSNYLALDEQAAGIDLFIGDINYLHKGLGPEIIKDFLANFVFTNPAIQSCVVGPEPKNTSAIRAYEKAGFTYLKTIQLLGEPEPEYLMRIEKTKI